MTEKGREIYTALRDRHITDVTSAFGRLRTEAEKIEEYRDDLPALQEIKNKVAAYESRHQTLAKAYLDFLQHANTAESVEDRTKFETTLEDHTREITQTVTRLQTLVTVRTKRPIHHHCFFLHIGHPKTGSCRCRKEAA